MKLHVCLIDKETLCAKYFYCDSFRITADDEYWEITKYAVKKEPDRNIRYRVSRYSLANIIPVKED